MTGRHQDRDADPVVSGLKVLGIATAAGVGAGIAAFALLLFLAIHFWFGGG